MRRTWLWVSLVTAVAAASGTPPVLRVESDNHYNAGKQIGARFESMILDRLQTDEKFHKKLLPWVRTAEGAAALGRLTNASRIAFPRYFEEIDGTSAGSGIPLEHLLVLNFRDELSRLLSPEIRPSSCSDYMLTSAHGAWVAHNEDGGDRFDNHTYIIEASISTEPLNFTAYVYAGELPSTAFGWNAAGVGFTLNAQHAPTNLDGVGRNFLSRALLSAKTLDEAVAIASLPNQATARRPIRIQPPHVPTSSR